MAAVMPKLENYIPVVVKGLALVCTLGIAHGGANLTWRIVDSNGVELPKPRLSQESSSETNTQLAGSADISKLHLLGIADAEPENVEESVTAPETRLSFELKGILAGDDEEEGSSAIIAQRGGAGEYFKVGDLVFGRARLAAVYGDHVLLNNNGKIEKLAFEDQGAGLIQKGRQVSKTPSPTPPKKSGNRFEDRLKEISTPEEFVDLARAELIEDPQQALDNLGVESSGEGYRVTNKAGMLLGLGMQSGDVILSINGQPLGNIEQDRGLIDEVYAAGQARIEVQRGNRRFIINHSFR